MPAGKMYLAARSPYQQSRGRVNTASGLVVRKRKGRRRFNRGIRAVNKVIRSFGGTTSGIPTNMRVKLKYVIEVTGQATGIAYVYAFRNNSLYDPDYSGAGAQPRTFDQWASLYSMYRVDAVAAKVTFDTDTASVNCLGILMAANSQNGTSGINTAVNAMESPYRKIARYNSTRPSRTLRAYFPIWKIEGVTRQRYQSDDLYMAPVTENPANYGYIAILHQASDLATTEVSHAWIELTYYAVFFNAKYPSGS